LEVELSRGSKKNGYEAESDYEGYLHKFKLLWTSFRRLRGFIVVVEWCLGVFFSLFRCCLVLLRGVMLQFCYNWTLLVLGGFKSPCFPREEPLLRRNWNQSSVPLGQSFQMP